MVRRLIPRFALLAALLAAAAFAPQASAAGTDELTAQQRYDRCLKLMKRGNHTKAIEECQKVRNLHRDDPVSVLAELAVADLHFKKGDFEQARVYYEDFARLHPNHPSLDLVIYRQGLSIFKRAPKAAGRDQAGTRQALNAWAGFDSRFPQSEHSADVAEHVARARGRLAAKELFIARFYATRGAWGSTAGRVETLLRRYPDSAQVPEALALGGRAYHSFGKVDDARRLRDQLAAQQPDSALLAGLDRALQKAPGVPDEDELFRRPYRMPGMGAAAMQQPPTR